MVSPCHNSNFSVLIPSHHYYSTHIVQYITVKKSPMYRYVLNVNFRETLNFGETAFAPKLFL